jgi:hypothetical protein
VGRVRFVRFERLFLDIMPVSNALDAEAVAEAVQLRIDDETTRVFTSEDAVAIALRTWRGKDRTRAAGRIPRGSRRGRRRGRPAARDRD